MKDLYCHKVKECRRFFFYFPSIFIYFTVHRDQMSEMDIRGMYLYFSYILITTRLLCVAMCISFLPWGVIVDRNLIAATP